MGGIGDLVANLAINKAPWTSNLAGARKEFSTFSSGISSGIGSLTGLLAGAFGVKVSLNAFSESLEASRKLEAVLQATGGAAGLSGQQIADYAGELQSMTNFEDDATVAAAASLAAFTNIRGETFFSAIDAAADLSSVMGGDLQSNVELVGKALNNPTEGLAKLARSGVQFTTAQEEQIKTLQKSGDMLGAQGVILDAIAGKFGGAAKATADPMKQLANTVGDVAENIGAALLPSVTVGVNALSELLGTVAGGGDTFKDFGIEAAVQLSSIGQYLVLSGTQAELTFTQMTENASHFFTEALPRYFEWFKDNGLNILTTFGTNWLQIHKNIADNIGQSMRELWAYIASGGTDQMEMAWKPLTDGFINTINALPDIPDRVVTEFEKSLAQSIEDQGNEIAESQAAFRKKMEDQFSPLKASVAGTAASDELADFTDAEKEKKTPHTKPQNTAALIGSSQAASMVLKGLTGGQDGEQAEQKKTNTKLDKLIAATTANKPAEPKFID